MTLTDQDQARIAEFAEKVRAEAEARERALPRRCSRCGVTENDAEWEMLFDVRVITADGEEGFADVVQLLCNDHLIEVTEALVALGFKDHRHGGANFLEDNHCPGAERMNACPTPDGTDEFPIVVRPPVEG